MENTNTPIDIVMRQTDYTKEVASEKLITHKNDIFSVIREWQAGPQTADKSESSNSTSQLIYKEIRNMMGNAAANYRRKKEMEQYISILQATQTQEQQQATQTQEQQQATQTQATQTQATQAQAKQQE
jgi:aspartate oxidase